MRYAIVEIGSIKPLEDANRLIELRDEVSACFWSNDPFEVLDSKTGKRMSLEEAMSVMK